MQTKTISSHRVKHEDTLQVKIARYIKTEYPGVIFFCDTGAGAKLSDTQRQVMMASRSDDGVPDLIIDFPSRNYHGMRLELKKEGTAIYKLDGKTLRKQPYVRRYRKYGKMFIKRGDHLAEQAAMLRKYNEAGYFARFAVGYDKAKELVDWYMDKKIELPF